ncbi:unnamed protein product, partial [Amoebophrya sp. A25]
SLFRTPRRAINVHEKDPKDGRSAVPPVTSFWLPRAAWPRLAALLVSVFCDESRSNCSHRCSTSSAARFSATGASFPRVGVRG